MNTDLPLCIISAGLFRDKGTLSVVVGEKLDEGTRIAVQIITNPPILDTKVTTQNYWKTKLEYACQNGNLCWILVPIIVSPLCCHEFILPVLHDCEKEDFDFKEFFWQYTKKEVNTLMNRGYLSLQPSQDKFDPLFWEDSFSIPPKYVPSKDRSGWLFHEGISKYWILSGMILFCYKSDKSSKPEFHHELSRNSFITPERVRACPGFLLEELAGLKSDFTVKPRSRLKCWGTPGSNMVVNEWIDTVRNHINVLKAKVPDALIERRKEQFLLCYKKFSIFFMAGVLLPELLVLVGERLVKLFFG